ncbi:exodeoxyribonuclease III [Hahella sp. KA22]|uniref:exodeoxyribonuclease III n=1 Tax=unclassified Hahella TaxID=2624107 RepID=UPI000FDF4549|nr:MULTISPECIES: exodeoxyribonuclease III [unclassified Hahella]AZZ94789.1 exodeoxyribonuclease III [Hahella sp. KA22]QAY58163.1 exodeoxyribonuclease III [Hahella sp. KA22]WLQ13699.1 exodeoxyribonuclease III [Hahella sp. HNIBRBA332]
MRVVTISVNGLKRAVGEGFFEWMARQDADVVCVQDHRMRVYELDEDKYRPEGYEPYFLDAEKLEDGGVGIYTRQIPKAIMMGFSYAPADMNGAFIQADFDAVSIASLMVPCALMDDEKQQAKEEYLEAFGNHLQKTLRKRRQFIFCGNFQTAHLVTDANPRYHRLEVSGFLPQERAWFDQVFDEMQYVDAFRKINREKNQYTWWPESAEGWRKHSGWRVDYQIATQGLRSSIKRAWIDTETRFSDHAPLIVDYDVDF